ncbi:hypothetical protein [Bradyrhizobium manausense]|uniref:Uncharacterized protein n=1 Tax=Bradyrhizobium manausense TaxID=989370 RepID=A0A0R3DXP7_9BRAD|nr:hypothetical protein [Bradyrhizobium manausense]KRQ14711.1 hypothetical protein AOQ71_12600 [Bradyrhizobium manausense]
MKDVQAHLEKLRAQIAECELIRDLATDPLKRDTFSRMAEHFRVLAGQLEHVIKYGKADDTFLGRRTRQP